jgi:hypothetical protein
MLRQILSIDDLHCLIAVPRGALSLMFTVPALVANPSGHRMYEMALSLPFSLPRTDLEGHHEAAKLWSVFARALSHL